MFNLVAVGSRQIGTHAAIVAGDNDTTSTCWLGLIIAVPHRQSGLLICFHQELGIFVLANTSDVDHRICWEEVLYTASRVLCRSSSQQFRLSVLDELFVERHVLLFRQDCIVRLETVLIEKGIITAGVQSAKTSKLFLQSSGGPDQVLFLVSLFARLKKSHLPLALNVEKRVLQAEKPVVAGRCHVFNLIETRKI